MHVLLALVLAAPAPRSVYKLHLADAAVMAASTAVIVGGYTVGTTLIHPRCPCDPSRLNPIDRAVVGWNSRAAEYGSDALVGLSYAAPLGLAAIDDGSSPAFAEDSAIAAESILVSGAAVTVVKIGVQRPLPRVYAGQAPQLVDVAGGYRSFYSGHVATAISGLAAASMTWNLRHGPTAWPWVVTGLTAAAIGAGRLAAGQHFPSDVAVGAVAGLGIGIAVPELHALHAPVQLGLAGDRRGPALQVASSW